MAPMALEWVVDAKGPAGYVNTHPQGPRLVGAPRKVPSGVTLPTSQRLRLLSEQ